MVVIVFLSVLADGHGELPDRAVFSKLPFRVLLLSRVRIRYLRFCFHADLLLVAESRQLLDGVARRSMRRVEGLTALSTPSGETRLAIASHRRRIQAPGSATAAAFRGGVSARALRRCS